MRIIQAIVLFCTLSASGLMGQNDSTFNCSAVLLNNKLVVNEYTTSGKCELAFDVKGTFTVQPVSLQEHGVVIPQGKHGFKIAIRDFNTKTLISFSDETFTEIEASKVLNKCKKGDSIVFITTDRELALPHNEVLVK